MRSSFMHVLAVLLALGWVARATPVASIEVSGPAGNGTGMIAKRMEAAIRGQDLRPYERSGRLLLVDMMLGDDATYSALKTAAEGHTDRSCDDWQRTARQSDYHLRQEWSIEVTTGQSGMVGLDSYFDCMSIGDGNPAEKWQERRSPTKGMFPDGPNVRVKLTQDKEYWAGDNRIRNAATNAVFETTFNIVDGIIVVDKRVSPEQQLIALGRHAGSDSEPKLTKWSDAIWRVWMSLRSRAPVQGRLVPFSDETSPFRTIPPYLLQPQTYNARGFINAIIFKAVRTEDTSSIITRCLAAGPWTNLPKFGDLGEGDMVPTFDIGHWCYYALIATSEGRDVVDFLAQHRPDLGHKIISSVQIFATDLDQNTDSVYPTVSFIIGDVADPDTMRRLPQNEGVWLPQNLQNRHLAMANQRGLRWEIERANWANRPAEQQYRYVPYWGRW